jgi:hypothetical protein
MLMMILRRHGLALNRNLFSFTAHTPIDAGIGSAALRLMQSVKHITGVRPQELWVLILSHFALLSTLKSEYSHAVADSS